MTIAQAVHIVQTDDRSDAQINRADATSHDERVDKCILLTKTEAMTIEHEISRDASCWTPQIPTSSSMTVESTTIGVPASDDLFLNPQSQ